jgi:hypothetical protein
MWQKLYNIEVWTKVDWVDEERADFFVYVNSANPTYILINLAHH